MLFGPVGNGSNIAEDFWSAPPKEEIRALAPTLLDGKTAALLSDSDLCVARKDFDAFARDVRILSDAAGSFDDRFRAVQELISLYSLYADPGEVEMTYFAYPISAILGRYAEQEQNFFLHGIVNSYFNDLSAMDPETPEAKRAFLVELKRLRLLESDKEGNLFAFGMGVDFHGAIPKSLEINALDDKEIDSLLFQIQIHLYHLYGKEKLDMIVQKARFGMKNAPEQLTGYDGNEGDAYDEEAWGFVSKVSPEIAVQYTLSRQIKRSFDLKDTKSDENAIEFIFAERFPNDQPRAERYSELYKQMMSLHMRKFVEDFFGIDLSEISISTQVQLLDFMKERDRDQLDFLRSFFHEGMSPKANRDRLLSFLSLEQGGHEMGQKIINIGKHLPTDVADRIFEKYAELVEASENAERFLFEEFDKEDKILARQVSSKLLQRGERLLITGSDTLDTLRFQYETATGEGILNRSFDPHADDHTLEDYERVEQEEITKLLSSLDSIRAHIELWKSGFRTLYEEGVIENFGEVSGVEFGIKSPEELSDEDKATMRKMYDENYPESAGYSKEFREVIFHGLEEAFTKKDVRFYVLKKDSEILGYNRFEDLPDTEDGRKRKYVGSFNVSPQYRGSKLGDKIFDDCLAQEISGDTIIEAYADPTLPISSHYLETNGFAATGIEDIGGRPLLKIVRDGAMNARLATKKESPDKEELTRLVEEGVVALEKTTRADMPAIASSKFEKGWLLTYISPDSKDKNIVTAVFEKSR